MRPIVAKSRHHMAHHITPSDSTIDVRDDHLGPVVPQEYFA